MNYFVGHKTEYLLNDHIYGCSYTVFEVSSNDSGETTSGFLSSNWEVSHNVSPSPYPDLTW